MFQVIKGEPSSVPYCNWQMLKHCPNLTATSGSASPPLIWGQKCAVKIRLFKFVQTDREANGFKHH